jgi:hypothetical protein
MEYVRQAYNHIFAYLMCWWHCDVIEKVYTDLHELARLAKFLHGFTINVLDD